MNKIDDGGPAFPMPSGPEPRVNEVTHFNEGMTLRDYFAAAAMQGMLASHALNNMHNGELEDHADAYLMRISDTAMRVADAMLEARKQQAHLGLKRENDELADVCLELLDACKQMVGDLRESRDTGMCARGRDEQISSLLATIARAEGRDVS